MAWHDPFLDQLASLSFFFLGGGSSIYVRLPDTIHGYKNRVGIFVCQLNEAVTFLQIIFPLAKVFVTGGVVKYIARAVEASVWPKDLAPPVFEAVAVGLAGEVAGRVSDEADRVVRNVRLVQEGEDFSKMFHRIAFFRFSIKAFVKRSILYVVIARHLRRCYSYKAVTVE